MAATDPGEWGHAEGEPPRALLDRIMPGSRTMRARRGQIVIAQGSVADEVHLALSGRYAVVITARDGQDVVVRDLGPGAIFGDLAALDRLPRSASVAVLTDGILARVAADAFIAAVTELPEAGRWFMRRLASEVRRLTDKTFELSVLSARDRLNCELLRLTTSSPHVGGSATLDPAPTHEALAQRIGSQREVVSRELGRLEAKGVVRRGRRRIEVDVVRLGRLVQTELGYAMP